jgi:uncharacterized protein YjbI with pentapeptide repeats
MANESAARSNADERCDRDDRVDKFISNARDIDAARAFVADAASVASGLWLTYLGILVYIAIAVGAVTHEDLFLERPVKLPFLGDVPLPLVAFFLLAPIVFVIWHAYTLLHFDILAAKVRVLEAQIEGLKQATPGDVLLFRWQLPANIFVQLLAGDPELRTGRIGIVSRLIARISLVIGPILLLLLIQIQFLPFHSWQITWLHRIVLLVDLVLLWTLWPVMVDSGKEIWSLRRGRLALLAGSCAALFVSVVLATFPGEWMEENFGFEWIPPNRLTAWLGAQNDQDQPVWTSFHDLLFAGQYDPRTQRRRSPFSNTLVLPDFDVLSAATMKDSDLASAKQTIARKRGHFEKAIFRGADLRKINLENAHLEGADFYQTKLQDAQMYNANLEGAVFYQAKLQGASFANAQLGGANLREAELEGANLFAAGLAGATLKKAKLKGAVLAKTSLPGAAFDDAEAQGVDLVDADLRGARLRGAQLQVASLKRSQLQGASFNHAELLGADLSDANLEAAWLNDASVWRADFAGADYNKVLAVGLKESLVPGLNYDQLRGAIALTPDADFKKSALERVSKLQNPSNATPPHASIRTSGKMSDADLAIEQEALADQLKNLVCFSRDEDVGNIVQGLIRDDDADSIVRETGPRAKALMDRILGPDCPASAWLTSQDKAAVRDFAEKLISAETPRY